MRTRTDLTRTLLIGLAVALLPATSLAEEPTHRHGRKFSRQPLPASVLKVAETMAARDDLSRPDRDNGSPLETMVDVHAADVVIQGSECVGLDCVASEDFNTFDTIRLKENNLRIKFLDTSISATFPADDWQIRINDSENGGLNLFAVDHVNSGRAPFVILGDARNSAIYAKGSNVGFGTSNPATNLHVTSADTPTLRLDQEAGGFASMVWDVAGNDVNFFIRDVLNGSQLPFRIRPGAPTSSLDIAASGNIGLGTDAPSAKLHVSGASPTVRVDNTGSGTTLSLDVIGNLTLSGLLFESSSREVKENLHPVDPTEVLDRLCDLDLWRWNYIADDASATHMGPTAEDFAAAFGLGVDDAHIAAMDASGVALSAIKALHRQAREKDARIDALKAELESERAKINRLAEQLAEIRALIETK